MVPVDGDLWHWPRPGGGTYAEPSQANSWAVITMIEVSADALATHPFLHGMSRDHLAVLASAASDVTFPVRHRLFEDGGGATRFWLIRSGHVALDLHVPGQGRMKIDTIGMGELLGWSWLFPPYKWAFGAVAASPVEAFEFDARAVRAHCGVPVRSVHVHRPTLDDVFMHYTGRQIRDEHAGRVMPMRARAARRR